MELEKEGMSSAHGEPLGLDNINLLRKKFEVGLWPRVFVPNEVTEYIEELQEKFETEENKWKKLLKNIKRFIQKKQVS